MHVRSRVWKHRLVGDQAQLLEEKLVNGAKSSVKKSCTVPEEVSGSLQIPVSLAVGTARGLGRVSGVGFSSDSC